MGCSPMAAKFSCRWRRLSLPTASACCATNSGSPGWSSTNARCRRTVEAGLACQVIDQAKGIFDIASGEFRLVLDDFAAPCHEPLFGGFDAVHGDLKDWTKHRAALNEEVDVPAMQADHLRVFAGDLEPELLDVERRGGGWVRRLNEYVCAEGVCHAGYLLVKSVVQFVAKGGNATF